MNSILTDRLTAYTCDENNEVDGRWARRVGETVKTCIWPDPSARGDGIRMRFINEYGYTRGPVSQKAIVDKNPSLDGLTCK
jgi:hypothetical protein